ncbi:MAG: bifunctional [glutamate--ammonia ligase]-adenylyl-L-tyrosine phosphorylase/[glutamate--ammonia-ligase] adenylyltransferase [Succinivibrionaceae bacterium]
MKKSLPLKCLEFANLNFSKILNKLSDEEIKDLEPYKDDLFYSVGLSSFLQNVFERNPQILVKIVKEKQFDAELRSDKYKQELQQILACINVNDDSSLKKALRDFRKEKMSVIAFRDLLNKATLEETFLHLSTLAEVIIVETLDFLYKKCSELYGIPMSEQNIQQKMLVIGMGKLGGRELNFSSDIDLIFCFPSRGMTVGARRSIDNQTFFTRLGQQLIQSLDQITADGQVYRVDMRLRPFGDSGPLVSSFASLEAYYLNHGRSWERYAMVKGRVLGAETPESIELSQMLRPFVFRRYLDFSAVESLRKMKAMIEAEVRRRQLHNNFKLGQGGIREVEFIAQVFQLMRGGRMIPLQEKHLLSVLKNLKETNCIDEESFEILNSSYRFLRKTENILQEINDEQTQTLPDKLLDQERLAHALDFNNYDEFLKKIQEVMTQIHHEFALIIQDPEADKIKEDQVFTDLWILPLSKDEIKKIVANHFKDMTDIDTLANDIAYLKTECSNKPIGTVGREILNKLIPYLFNKIANLEENVIVTFDRLSKLLVTIVSRTTYLQLLLENAGVCDHLIKLCSKSELIASQITEHPVLLDELLMPQTLYTPPSQDEYPQELREFMLRVESNDLEQQMESLRQFKQIQLLRICAADLVGALPLMKVSDNLTFLAQTILGEVINLAWGQLVDKYGVPSNAVINDDKGVCVIAYGKLGGIELGYGSDLDLVFLCDDELDGETNGEKPISDRMFYGRFAQRIMHLFSTRLSSGILYEVDARLRPEGDSGPLICTISGYENYLKNKAWTWELQALVRARAVLGPQRLLDKFVAIRDQVLRQKRDEEKLRTEVVEMRNKMRSSLMKGPKDAFDIKQGLGGMVDIEFMAQFLVLKNARQCKDFVLWSDNVRIFEECSRLKLIEEDVAKRLISSYLAIRNTGHKLTLQGLHRIVYDDSLNEERAFVQNCWHEIMKE